MTGETEDYLFLALRALFEEVFLDAGFSRVAEIFFAAPFLRFAGEALGGLSIPVFTAILPSALPIICAVVVRSASAVPTSCILRFATLGPSLLSFPNVTGQYSRYRRHSCASLSLRA